MTTRRLLRTILARSRSWLLRHPTIGEGVDRLFVAGVLAYCVLTRMWFRKPAKPTAADWDRMAEETRVRTAARARRGLA